ncbi:MAG: hypothetical protein ACI9SP_000747 [Arenicella sp.]|jgi:hypothetical protein
MSDNLTFQFNNKTLLGQVSGSMIEMPSLAVAGDKRRSDHPDSQEAKDKKLRDFIDLVDLANAFIEQLRQDIEELEAGFRARYGDAWREKLALKILDPDEIPQRREGESIEDYRQRLEPILTDRMLDADGSIKPQYLNDPELFDYAQWAQKNHHYNLAVGYVRELEDPSTTPERKEEIAEELKQNTDIETINYTDRGLTAESDAQRQVKDITDSVGENLAKEQLYGSWSEIHVIGYWNNGLVFLARFAMPATSSRTESIRNTPSVPPRT